MSGRRGVAAGVLGAPWCRSLVFAAALMLSFSFLSPYFFSLSNFDNILSASAVTGLLALGVTFVVAGGGIDLSLASVMALSGTVCASIIQTSELGPCSSFAICALVGTVCGAITGSLIVLTNAPSFIVTLGMLSVARAVAYIVADGTPIYGLPPSVTALGQGRPLGISNPAILFLVAAIVAHVVMHRTKFGGHALALGDNAFAARAMGVRTAALRIRLFTVCGLFAGIAGFVFMARTNAGDPTAGQNYELVAITAVILGGTNLFGGRATITGTVLGVICLGVLQNGLNLMAVSTYYQVLFVGLVLIGAALLERIGGDA